MTDQIRIQKLLCPLCNSEVPDLVRQLEEDLAPKLIAAIQGKYPAWTTKDGVCIPCLNMVRNMVAKPSLFKRLKGGLQARLASLHHPQE